MVPLNIENGATSLFLMFLSTFLHNPWCPWWDGGAAVVVKLAVSLSLVPETGSRIQMSLTPYCDSILEATERLTNNKTRVVEARLLQDTIRSFLTLLMERKRRAKSDSTERFIFAVT